jgi:hypothetical protein
MKIPELYFGDICFLTHLIDCRVSEIVQESKKLDRGLKVRRVFRIGFKNARIIAEIRLKSMAAEIEAAAELRNKLYEARGMDDDGKEVTFIDMAKEKFFKQKQQ